MATFLLLVPQTRSRDNQENDNEDWRENCWVKDRHRRQVSWTRGQRKVGDISITNETKKWIWADHMIKN